MNTMGTYFGWAKRAEGHRISAINYAKLYRFIAVELSLPREERMNPNDFLKVVKDTYDRLAEISPMIPPSIIHKFQRRFKKVNDIAKPEEANGLHKIQVYRVPGDDAKSPDVRIKIGPVPETFSVKNPMLAVKKDAIPSRPSVESLEEIEKSVAMPTLSDDILKEAKEAPSS
jgi:hypothetical protein